jgi:hypothetical protein
MMAAASLIREHAREVTGFIIDGNAGDAARNKTEDSGDHCPVTCGADAGMVVPLAETQKSLPSGSRSTVHAMPSGATS